MWLMIVAKIKTGQMVEKSNLSCKVALHGHFSNLFFPDLTRLATLSSA
jgi:hypothetical protein